MPPTPVKGQGAAADLGFEHLDDAQNCLDLSQVQTGDSRARRVTLQDGLVKPPDKFARPVLAMMHRGALAKGLAVHDGTPSGQSVALMRERA